MTKPRAQTMAGIPKRRAGRASQRGLGLLIILIVGGVLGVVIVGSAIVDRAAADARERSTRDALARAKEALIAYASARMDDGLGNVPDTPGHLPCPAIAPPAPPNFPEGSSAGTCGDANDTAVGRLPWRTMGIPPPRDGTGECLWYAVSGRFKQNPRGSEIFNWDTEGQIRVVNSDGSLVADKVAAVIMAPGTPRDQTRTPGLNAVICAGSHNPADYLEPAPRGPAYGASNHTMADSNPANQPALSTLIAGGIDPATKEELVNDRLAIITTDEIVAAYQRRKDFGAQALRPDPGWDQGRLRKLMAVIAGCYGSYAQRSDPDDRRLPWAGSRMQTAPITQGGTTLTLSEIRSQNLLLAGRAPSRYDTFTPGFGSSSNPNYIALLTGCLADPAAIAWWNQWRDHFYYAVSPDFSPAAPKPVTACADLSPNRCLRVNGSTARYAGILIFAGRRIPPSQAFPAGQTRPQWSAETPTPLDARQTYANYLEGINLANISAAPTYTPLASGGTGDVYRSDATPGPTMNDFAFCIEVTPTTTTVTPCP